MNVDNWISDIINARESFTVPIMTHPGIEMIGATVKDVVPAMAFLLPVRKPSP